MELENAPRKLLPLIFSYLLKNMGFQKRAVRLIKHRHPKKKVVLLFLTVQHVKVISIIVSARVLLITKDGKSDSMELYPVHKI